LFTEAFGGQQMKRLSIVVPYRSREAHLQHFVPHLRAYFSRDKVDREIPYRVLVIEQEHGIPFNRGALKNIGFVLGRDESDYTAFHDVDYLPIWADYTSVDSLTPIVWFGAEVRPLVPGRREGVINDMNQFFGGVVLVPNSGFEQVNGFANQYWGWGYEDVDLAKRFIAAGFSCGRRRGTFQPLAHKNESFGPDGKPTPFAAVNERLYRRRWTGGRSVADDGLSSLAFEVLHRRSIPDGPLPERPAQWEIVTVRLNMQIVTEHLEAHARANPSTPAFATGWKININS
jgi:hypothetical protein